MIMEETVLVLKGSTLKYSGEKCHGFCCILSMAQEKIYIHRHRQSKYSKIFTTVVSG